jgi:hypothetical protein
LYAFLNSVQVGAKLKLVACDVSAINMYYDHCLSGEVPKIQYQNLGLHLTFFVEKRGYFSDIYVQI